jgi:hypothetical protein
MSLPPRPRRTLGVEILLLAQVSPWCWLRWSWTRRRLFIEFSMDGATLVPSAWENLPSGVKNLIWVGSGRCRGCLCCLGIDGQGAGNFPRLGWGWDDRHDFPDEFSAGNGVRVCRPGQARRWIGTDQLVISALPDREVLFSCRSWLLPVFFTSMRGR